MNELSAGLAQPPSCAWHNIDSCHNFSGVSALHGSLQSMWPASGKNHTVLCVIHPDSDTLVCSQGTRWVHSHSCAWDSPFHAVSSTHLLTAPTPLITCQSGNALLLWHHSASMQPGAAGAHPTVLCGGRSKEEAWQACHQVGMLAAGTFPAPRPREVPHLTVKYTQGTPALAGLRPSGLQPL